MNTQKFTIGQALRKISRLKGDVSKFHQRAMTVLSYNKDEKPAFSFEDSIQARDKAREELILLSARVAETNANTSIEHDKKEISLAHALRILQELKARIAEYRALGGLRGLALRAEHETTLKEKRMKFEDITGPGGQFVGQRQIEVEEETVIICHVTASERAEAIEKLEAEFEQLNNAVERANHATVFEVSL